MPISDDALKGMIQRGLKQAKNSADVEIAPQRQKALAYANGEMDDLKAEKGRSSVMSMDVNDTMNWIRPQLIDVFLGSDRMVLAQPVGEDDDDQAQDATVLLNHVFLKDNPGYKIVSDVIIDAALCKFAIVKLWNDDTPEYTTSFHSGLSDEQLALLEDDEEVEITNQTTTTEVMAVPNLETGMVEEMPVNVHEVKLRRLRRKGVRRLKVIPGENFYLDAEATCMTDSRLRAHREPTTRSDLLQMGFDRKQVMDLSPDETEDPEDYARGKYTDGDDAVDKSTELIDLWEVMIDVDVDDDGIAETVRAFYAGELSGGELLDWEVWEDEQLFYDVPWEPVPHKFAGRSLADDTMPIQKMKTAMLRQVFDNTYAANNPQMFVTGEIVNPDALFSPTFGSHVFGKNGATVTPLPVPFVANHGYEALAYADEMLQKRTGLSRQSMALDPDVLTNQTATANQNNKDASYSQAAQVAKDMSELGWTPIFRALLKMEIKHQDRPRQIRMGAKTISIDPRHWNADMDITMNLGLGTGSRDRDMAMLQGVLGTQMGLADRFIANGMNDEALDMLPKIISTLELIAEAAGIRAPENFYPEFTEEKVAQLKQMAAERAAKPDPKIEAEQAKVQAQTQARLQEKQIDAQVALQSDKQKSEVQVRTEQAQLEADLATQAAEREATMAIEAMKQQLEREKLDREDAYRYAKLAQDRDLALLAMVDKQEKSGDLANEPVFS